MKLQFEDWVEKNLSDNAMEMMKEAIICYKVSAYRAAYFISYLSFKITIRERILTAQKPSDITEGCWENIISTLKDDNHWEEKLNTLIDAVTDSPKEIGRVFKFSNIDKIKNRYNYWKNIRNACAHAQEEHITSATVEQFWNYMQDNLPEFYVLGGKHYLVDQLGRIYKYFYSLETKEIEKILADISSVYTSNVKECFDMFYKENKSCLVPGKTQVEFWSKIINSGNDHLADGFIDFLYEYLDVFYIWFAEFPQIFELMYNRHRLFIQEEIGPSLENGYYNDDKVMWKLLVNILQKDNRLIDIDKVTNDYNKLHMIRNIDLSPIELDFLREQKIFNKFLLNAGKAFFNNDSSSHYTTYTSTSYNDDDIETCFKYLEWDITVIDKMNSALCTLEESCECRTNYYSILYGKTRRQAYLRIIDRFRDDIKNTIENVGKNITEYPYIHNIMVMKNEN